MANYLLDTNILSYWYDGNCDEHAKVLDRIQAVCQPDPQTGEVPRLFVSAITIGEIEYGHRVSPTPDSSAQTEYMTFVREQCPEHLEITGHVGEDYGELRAWLFNNLSRKDKRTKAKRPEELIDPITSRELGVQENDIWIAAQAMTHGLVLVTHDSRGHFGELLRHFKSTLQIDVEDWAQ
jgi:predicted nucleic acid-binding protein